VATIEPTMPMRIHPSILAADFTQLADELQRIRSADAAHVDVMDYHFVPNLSFGLPVVERLVTATPLPLDVHLMVDDPGRWGPDYAAAGAESVTFHAEAAADPRAAARRIREAGAGAGSGAGGAGDGTRVGLAIKPGSPIEPYLELLDAVDMVLIMTVEPGFGGQGFIESTMPKLERMRAAIDTAGLDVRLQVDGGVDERTIAIAAEHGADTFVAGTSVFRAENAAAQIDLLRRTAAEHAHSRSH
jgi:ribulose-phosphate 3-epimerase